MLDRVFDQIVGDIQQPAQEDLVALLAFLEPGLAVAASRQLLGIESALGADRHDDGVLHLLGLDQAQHFGAEILPPIRPAQAAARHGAEADMHAFHPRGPHEDLPIGFRFGQAAQLAAGDL
jgi:hypothetical protein